MASKKILVSLISLGWLAFWPAHSLAVVEPPIRFDFETDAQYDERLQVLERLTNTSNPVKSITNSSVTAAPKKVQSTGSQMLTIPWWTIVIVILLSVIWFYESHRRQLMILLRRWQTERASGWSSAPLPTLEKDAETSHYPAVPNLTPTSLPIVSSPEVLLNNLEPKLQAPPPPATIRPNVDQSTMMPTYEHVPPPGRTDSLPQTIIREEQLAAKPVVISKTESASPVVETKPRRMVKKKAIFKPTSIRTKKVRVLSKKELRQPVE